MTVGRNYWQSNSRAALGPEASWSLWYHLFFENIMTPMDPFLQGKDCWFDSCQHSRGFRLHAIILSTGLCLLNVFHVLLKWDEANRKQQHWLLCQAFIKKKAYLLNFLLSSKAVWLTVIAVPMLLYPTPQTNKQKNFSRPPIRFLKFLQTTQTDN